MIHEMNPSEILEVLKARIAGFTPEAGESEIGKVVQAGDGIAHVWGLPGSMAGELVEIESGGGKTVEGLVMNLEEDTAGVILFSGCEHVKEGDTVRRTGRVAEVPVGRALLGRVVNPLGDPLDGLGPIKGDERRKVDAKGPGIVERQNVVEPLQTGIKAIDSMIPIGRGQRELIIGDRRTGKSTIAIDTIINQKTANGGEPVFCFYVVIGQKGSTVVRLVETLKRHGAMEYTTVVCATASDAASLQYLAPYSATSMAEYFRDSGSHALIVYDDLSKHAQAYRELSLLMRRPPGREAYPGDVFYLHSRLLERAAKMSGERGGGSLTALPIVETQEGEVSAYIPTNVISITDGQIFLEANLFNSGLRPAVNVGISVSRVGGDAQVKAMRQTAGALRINLAQFRELAAFMQFSSDVDQTTRRQLDRGERLMEILKQRQYSPIDVYKQVMILKAGISGRLDKYPTDKLLVYQDQLFGYLDGDGRAFMDRLRAAKAFTPELEQETASVFDAFEAGFRPEDARSGTDSGYTPNLAMALTQRTSPVNREMLKLVEGIASRDLSSPILETEIEEIMQGSDTGVRDRFDSLIASAPILEYEKSASKLDAFRFAAAALSRNYRYRGSETIYRRLVERENQSCTALSPFFALPHAVVEGTGRFGMAVVRSKRGVKFNDEHDAVHAMFFLIGSVDERHFHLVVLSNLARIVNDPSFESAWIDASGPEELRKLILRLRPRKEQGA